jgi:hypothetical protein
MPLASRRIDLPDIGKITRSSRCGQVMAFRAILLDTGLAEMPSVGEVVKRVSGTGTLANVHRLGPIYVAGLAGGKLFARLV